MIGFTIDSIKMFISWDNLLNYDFHWLESITNPKIISRGWFKDWKEGSYKNFKIKYRENHGIYLSGSISNFYVGYVSLLQYDQLKNAIDKLSKELNLNLHAARLFRVDLALNIETNKPIRQYTHKLFTDLPRSERLEQGKGLRFELGKIVFAIYNKTKELSDKRGIKINKNILRLELRLLGSLDKKFLIEGMRIQNLYSPSTYRKLVSIFYEYYQKIKKQTIPSGTEKFEFLTLPIFKNILMRGGIEKYPEGEKGAYAYIEQLDKEGKIKSANEKYKCRKLIKESSNNENLSKVHPLADEINRKVEIAFREIIKNANHSA